jgi:homoserine dehydrogenase
MIAYRNLRVALLGAGSVGAQVATLLTEHHDELASRVGAGLDLIGIAVRDVDAPRTAPIDPALFTTVRTTARSSQAVPTVRGPSSVPWRSALVSISWNTR